MNRAEDAAPMSVCGEVCCLRLVSTPLFIFSAPPPAPLLNTAASRGSNAPTSPAVSTSVRYLIKCKM